MNTRKQGGFTLIELIAVIVILGILAAFAIPRYASLESSARTSSVKGLAGALTGASALTHSLALANGVATTASGSTVTLEGSTINLVYGYPDTSAANGIQVAANLSADYTPGSAAGATQTFTITSYAGANCLVTYTKATSASVGATVTYTVSGC